MIVHSCVFGPLEWLIVVEAIIAETGLLGYLTTVDRIGKRSRDVVVPGIEELAHPLIVSPSELLLALHYLALQFGALLLQLFDISCGCPE